MPYFNYHAKIRNLIKSNECLLVALLDEYNKIKPAMVFYFKNHIPMPVRYYMWDEYFSLIKEYKIKLVDENNVEILDE